MSSDRRLAAKNRATAEGLVAKANRFAIAALALASLISGCGRLSDVGDQEGEESAPVADAVVLNHPFSKDSSGNVTTSVRSGSEVFLSGKDSDGAAAPVLSFEWCQRVQDSCVNAQDGVSLVTRNSNTVSFTAPMVAQDTVLQFRITVTDADGKTDSKDVDVNVVGIPDTDHFLSYNLDDTRQIKLVAIGSRAVKGTELNGDVGIAIDVQRLVNYTTDSPDGPFLELGSETFTAKWLAGYGVGAECSDAENPSLNIPVPAVDMDEIIAKVGATNAEVEPNPARVDDFRLKLQISIRVLDGALPSDVTPLVCADGIAQSADTAVAARVQEGQAQFKQTDLATGLLEISIEELIGEPSTTLDTPTSAAAYYAVIDPQEERVDLPKWLAVNDFIPDGSTTFSWSQLAEASSAHAAYTNNFDLGFGRDMYARVVRCDDGVSPPLGQPIARAQIGRCDIAAVVINYSSLEAATKRLNPVLAVAMEHSIPRNGSRRIVQFYAFAPDSVTGKFERVSSANLDGRGEKYIPQVCTVCHGGTPGGLTASGTYENGGDINATFLPWDVDSFLFADTEGNTADPSYSDQEQRHLYTRDAQAEQLRRLNQIAYLTYEDSTRPNRFTLPRQLIEGWYGTQGDNAFANSAFNSSYLPAGWSANGVDGAANTADDNPADAPTIYHDVFARNCRACHVAHAPASTAGGAALELLTEGGIDHNTCDISEPDGEPAWSGAAGQLPISCYRQFVTARNLSTRLSDGQMPFARLTMDRFWVGSGATEAAPAQQLFDHLNEVYSQQPESERPTLAIPGTPSACFTGLTNELERGKDYRLDASCSRFAQQYQWTVQGPSGASIAFDDSQLAVLRGVSAKGTYSVTLETAAGVTRTIAAARADSPITVPALADQQLSLLGGQNTVVIATGAGGGDGLLALTAIASDDTAVVAQIASDQSILLTAQTLTVADDPVTVSYTVSDADGDSASGQFSVSVTADLAANSFTTTPAPVRRTGSLGSAVSIDLLSNVTHAPEEELVFEVSNTSGIVGTNDTRSSLSVGVNTGVVTYTPPPGRMSQFRDGGTLVVFSSAGADLHDRFTYTVRYSGDPNIVRTGTVTIPIQGNTTNNNVSFQLLYADSTSTNDLAYCSSCHGTASYPQWYDGTNAKVTYCNLKGGSDSVTAPNFYNPYTDLDTPGDSALYLKPTGGLQHGGGVAGTDSLHTKILNWISEGAYYTAAPGQQDCP